MSNTTSSTPNVGRKGSFGGLPISAGTVLLKKYRVEKLIGEGGTGVVVAATHVQLERRVAIKFLRQALADDELKTRFDREARAIGRIESDHVVMVLDHGALEDNSPYMVMEHLEGRDLARVLKEDGALPVEQAVDCMLQVCEALAEAHANGIVHRDLKPANLFLTRQDDDHVHIKVVDFGISKILDKKLLENEGKPQEVTSAFTVLGSPRWMAPEQIRNSKDVDHRADLWSVGAVLFQLLTAKHAFEAEGNVQASLAVLTGEPRSLIALAPHVPVDLEKVILKCLTKEVSERYQTANELAEALRPFASDRAVDSLERIQTMKQEPRVDELIAIAPSSTPPPRQDAGPGSIALQPGSRDVPTERKIRAAPPAPEGQPTTTQKLPRLPPMAPGAPAQQHQRHEARPATPAQQPLAYPPPYPPMPSSPRVPSNKELPKVLLAVFAVTAVTAVVFSLLVVRVVFFGARAASAPVKAAPPVPLDAGSDPP